jgi:hypothetical protein|nr:MAG TPA: 43 kDa tail protein [Caudoviricetes sp.]
MYPITSAGLAALREDVVQSVNILCTPTKGTAFNITDKDIIGAVTVDWSSITGSKLDLGSACMSELSFTLENTNGAFDDKVFEGAQLYVTTSFSTGSTTETVPIGYYTVDSPPRKLRSIKITAYDRMAKFNRAYDSKLAYPATLYQIVADACTKCGVSQKLPTNTLHRGVSIPKRPEADNLTYRQVLVWAAELMGVSLYIDYDGKLTGGWYATNAKHAVIKASDRFTSGNTNFAENNIVFSGVRIVGNDENKTEYLAGTKDYAFNIEGNLLVQSDMSIDTLATELKTARCSLTYTPMSCTTHSFPHLRPLDILKFETAQGTKKVVLTNVKWQSQNRCTKLEGKGETATQSGYATMGAFTPKQQAILEQTRAQQAAQINDFEQATLALNETIANSMGLYVTRKADSNGAVITYYHDKPTLEGSNTIYCRNAGGYAWTNNGWNNGSPNWEYGVSKDGDAVIRSIAANKISASYITTDILSSPTGKFSFNLDTGHIEASDINITGGDINLDGGQLSIENSGFKTDLSSGYLQMYYTTNMQTGANYEYFDINNTLIGTKFYATLAALKPAAALGVTSNGFRFGEKAENATLVNHWNTDYAVIEKDNARFRKKVEVNEPLSVAAGGDAIGFIAHAPNGANDVSAELGATSDASALLQIVNNTKGTIPARIEIYSSGTNGKGMTLKLTSGGGYTGRLFLDTTGLYAEFNDSGDYKKLA